MAETTGAFPYDIDNLLGGAVRVLYAPTSVAIPADLGDIIDLTSPYAAATGWIDVGATKESFSYTRGFESEGYEIQQVNGNVIEEITNVSRSITVSIAEFRASLLKIIENAPAVATVDGGSAADQEVVRFGSFTETERYRWAFVARRSKVSGTVDEGTIVRGRFFAGVLYSASLAADDVTFEQAKGSLTAAGVSFNAFPVSTEDEGEEVGAWFDEQALAGA